MDLMSLVARLTLDKSDYDKGLDDASKGATGFAAKLKNGLGTAAKVGAAAVTAVAGAATAMSAAFAAGANEAAQYGDNIDKASQKLGISAKAYQEWDAVLQHSGTSIDSMGIGMKTLANAAASGSDAFENLGISTERAASMSREDLFAETITALQNVTDENKRAQLAQELFGRSAMELGPLLNTSAADTQAMKDRVNELGGVMSNEAVKAAAAYQDSLQDMQTAFSGMKRNLMGQFLPAITTVMDGVTDLFTGGGVEKISEGIGLFVDKVTEIAPQLLEKGGQIIMALIQAINNNLPALVKAATKTIITFVRGLVDQLPSLIEAGLQIILELAMAIAEALPELIPAIVDVIIKIVEILTDPDNLSRLVDAAIAIILALVEGIIDALPRLIEAAPRIIMNLVEAIVRNLPKILEAGGKIIIMLAKGIVQAIGKIGEAMGQIIGKIGEGIRGVIDGALQWGKDLINNFTEGIKSFISRPIEAVKGLAGRIKSFLGFSEPEEGPLANFHTFAPDMMELFAKGIRDNVGLITDAIGTGFDLGPAIQSAAAPAGGAGQEFTTPARAAGGRQEAVMQVDRTVFARLIYRLYNEEAARVGVSLAGGVL